MGNKTKALLDTGSSHSIITKKQYFGSQEPNVLEGTLESDLIKMRAANGTNIKCWGLVNPIVTIAGRDYPSQLYIADVVSNILGMDFLSNNGLSFKVKGDKVFMEEDLATFPLLDKTQPTVVPFSTYNT
jgi:hypothetical protein